MSTMISEVYDALKEAGASEEKARKAAETLASYDSRFSKIDERFAAMDGRLTLLQWMLGFNLAMTVAILWKVFSAPGVGH
jgi:hypothetical protein